MTASASPVWFLRPVAIDGLPGPVPIDGGATLGRAASNTVALSEAAYPQVSAHHVRLVVDAGGGLAVEDLGSRNGTFVDDRRVSRAELRDGELLRLGPGGPQFVIEWRGAASVTQCLGNVAAPPGRSDPTQSTLIKLKRALGVPENSDVGQLVRSSERRGRRRLLFALVGGAAGLVAVTLLVRAAQGGERQRLLVELDRRFAEASSTFDRQLQGWNDDRRNLERERASIERQLQAVAAHEQSSAADLDGLRRTLQATNDKLQRYDPVNLEHDRLVEVGRVQRAVVLIETRVRFRSQRTQKLLRVVRDPADPTSSAATFDEAAELFERESSGSGFCIDGDGSIVTNAHVVRPGEDAQPIEIGDLDRLEPELVFTAVFSGSDVRHPAQIAKVLEQGDDDLALLHIEPFADMPHLDGFTADAAEPAPGAEVYLHGFPLGKMAIQDGERVIASSFRGILSRRVANWLQVDAAVHPGNSGGPLTDAQGHVIGVVCRVQRIPEGSFAPDMGYAIPIAAVARLLGTSDGK